MQFVRILLRRAASLAAILLRAFRDNGGEFSVAEAADVMRHRALVVDRLRWLAEAAVQDGHAGSDRDAPVVGLHPIDQAPDCFRGSSSSQFLDLAQFWCLLRPPSGIAGLSL